MKLSDVVKKVIDLAQTVDDYWEAELPKRHPDYPLVNPGEDSGPPPPEQSQLRKLLTELPEETLYKLLLIMDLGQSATSPPHLAKHFEQLKEDFADPEWVVSLLVAKAPLADYLIDGLDKLAMKKIDVDKLLQKGAKVRR